MPKVILKSQAHCEVSETFDCKEVQILVDSDGDVRLGVLPHGATQSHVLATLGKPRHPYKPNAPAWRMEPTFGPLDVLFDTVIIK